MKRESVRALMSTKIRQLNCNCSKRSMDLMLADGRRNGVTVLAVTEPNKKECNESNGTQTPHPQQPSECSKMKPGSKEAAAAMNQYSLIAVTSP